jgi:hypothetical protein
MGFDGIIVTDALVMEGAHSGRSEEAAAVEALRAGADLLLYPADIARVCRALREAAEAGALPPPRIEEAERRYEAALSRAAAPPAPAPPGPYESANHLADALIDRGLPRGTVRGLRQPIGIVVVDDDLGGPYPPGPSDYLARWLADHGVGGAGGARVLAVFAEPRAWKGRAGLGPEARELLAREAPGADLVILFGHPRLAAEVPGGRPLLLAWHRQRLMQEAAARWLAARAG